MDYLTSGKNNNKHCLIRYFHKNFKFVKGTAVKGKME